ncbi:EscF/YscF/HrpA family type III secretion system needle major subunit [Pandoraea pneumonica]|uniref:EscF/YscF/HrpA family type III secretion system needle major subunit n=1 Tax=Pandoraea pneumonica TaxID=2508299 RepID=A0A5E4UXD3_9BURK|nr:EscF/YscF/HrpA family type III secretion system needle major subunit [Pandoraea pneumonica]VVE03984.1 EscF/YscF/HrpA family type III secretion system needle major subunit [Pandoraea pneumonica]
MADITPPDGYRTLETMSWAFDETAKDLDKRLQEAFEEVKKKTSDASALAAYQARLGEKTMVLSAQSSTVKTWRDTAAGIIQKF